MEGKATRVSKALKDEQLLQYKNVGIACTVT